MFHRSKERPCYQVQWALRDNLAKLERMEMRPEARRSMRSRVLSMTCSSLNPRRLGDPD